MQHIESDLANIIRWLVVVLVDPAEVEDARYSLAGKVVMVTPEIEAVRVVLYFTPLYRGGNRTGTQCH